MRARLLSKILVITFVSFVLTIPQAFAGERPPAGAKPLVEIIQKLEAEGYSPITEISMAVFFKIVVAFFHYAAISFAKFSFCGF
ncbi:hypothetical protein OQJ64_13915, partial [Microbulbifer thermotolerans]|nr:hypothetical protein [Microbulbifer thermotolerans]